MILEHAICSSSLQGNRAIIAIKRPVTFLLQWANGIRELTAEKAEQIPGQTLSPIPWD